MIMENAKNEFLGHIERKGKVVCARIERNSTRHILREKYTKEDFDKFLDELDFEYDDGYGGQELFGIILFKKSYSDRYEYDGSESWNNHKMPTVRQVLSYKG